MREARTPRTDRARANQAGGGARAFTLVEMLVVIAAIATLVALLFTAASNAMNSSRTFKCTMSMRSVAFDFQVFADDGVHGDRGADRTELPEGEFRLETFQESQYGLDEFWRYGEGEMQASLPTPEGDNPMRCAEVRGPLTLRRDTPCSATGALEPPQSVSYTFNARLHRAEVVRNQMPTTKRVTLTSTIRGHGNVPLLWDVDGGAAVAKGLASPVFSAPSVGSQGVYANDMYWFPSFRHGGRLNVAFIDGRVETTDTPLVGNGWRWDFQPTD